MLLLAAGLVGSPADSIAAPAAVRTGIVQSIVVEPDRSDVRIVVSLDAPFHYLIDRHDDRVVLILDPVSAAAADHALTVGPVRSLRVRSIAGAPPRAEITIFTFEPVEAVESSVDGHTLAVRLTAAGRGPGANVSTPSAPGAPLRPLQPSFVTQTAAPNDVPRLPERIAGRTIVPRSLTLDEGTGRLLEVDHLARVAVSDPRIVGVVPVSSRELLLTARAAGRATVYVWEGRDRLLSYTVDVQPGEDPFRELRRALAALLPAAAITVTEIHGARPSVSPAAPGGPQAATPPAASPTGGSAVPQYSGTVPPASKADVRGAVLSGTVETQIDKVKAGQLAHAFVADVVDLLTVRHPVQLSLRVEVVELNRNAQETLGIAWGGGQQPPGASPSLNGGVYNLQIITAPGASTNGLDLLIAQLEALSQRGQARLLARPGLVVLAGRTASLLLGGQVPVPVAGPNGTVTIEYKDFGVILTAKPEFQDDGRVFLQVTPEVSTLDFTDAIRVSGFEIPALRVRRAQTMVAMRLGETLVLGGLLQREDVQQMQKVPLLADVPIIGALFRSRSFQRRESDLLILVTPQRVESSDTQ